MLDSDGPYVRETMASIAISVMTITSAGTVRIIHDVARSLKVAGGTGSMISSGANGSSATAIRCGCRGRDGAALNRNLPVDEK